jgi:hypothetical protein
MGFYEQGQRVDELRLLDVATGSEQLLDIDEDGKKTRIATRVFGWCPRRESNSRNRGLKDAR